MISDNWTKPASVSGSHQEGGHSTKGTSCLPEDRRYIPCTLIFYGYACVIVMARTTWTPQQGRHNAPIQSWLHSQTLLLGSPILRALPVWKTGSRITPDINPLDLVHSNVCGPMPHQSLGGASYFISLIDDLTRKVWAYPIRSDVLDLL